MCGNRVMSLLICIIYSNLKIKKYDQIIPIEFGMIFLMRCDDSSVELGNNIFLGVLY